MTALLSDALFNLVLFVCFILSVGLLADRVFCKQEGISAGSTLIEIQLGKLLLAQEKRDL